MYENEELNDLICEIPLSATVQIIDGKPKIISKETAKIPVENIIDIIMRDIKRRADFQEK